MSRISRKLIEHRFWEKGYHGVTITSCNLTPDGVKIMSSNIWCPPMSRYLFAYPASTQSEMPLTKNGSKISDVQNTVNERKLMLNRLLYRSRQRGYLELDLLLGKWTEENIKNLDDKHIEFLIEVLDQENPELWKWLTGQESIPDFLTANPVFMAIHKKIMGALNTHAPPETRAKLGQPWVRGWDDNRKVGGPQVGNQ